MKWIGGIRSRVGAALLLSAMLLSVLINNYWEQSNVQHWDESFSSIYDDRLLPATYIFKLTERLYKKRLLWGEAARAGSAEAIRAKLDEHDEAIDALVMEFETTVLVDAEKQALKGFKSRWRACRDLERRWVDLPSEGSLPAMEAEFDQALHQLNMLSRIQEQVGFDLKKGSKNLLASSSILSRLQIVLLIVIGLLIPFLVLDPRSLGRDRARLPQKPRGSHLH